MVVAPMPRPLTMLASRDRRLPPSTSWVAFSARANDSRASEHVVADDLVVRAAEVLGELALLAEPPRIGAGEAVGPADVHGEQVAGGPGGDAGRPADQRVALRATGETDHDALTRLPGLHDVVLLPVDLQPGVDAIGQPEQRQLAQRGQVAGPEVVAERGIDLVGGVDVAVRHPAAQRLGRHVDQLDLVGAADDHVGHGLALRHAGDLLDHVVDRLEVLDVDRRDDVDPGVQQVVDVLPALGVRAAVRHVGVREFVDQGDLGPAVQHGGQVHLGEAGVAVLARPCGARSRGRRSAPRCALRPWVSTKPTTTSVPRSSRRLPSLSMA